MRTFRPYLIVFVIGLSALVGCRQDDEITTSEVAHPDREPFRLRVAIVEQRKSVWFFLLKGPEAEVTKNVETFNEFVRSVRFDNKKEPISFTAPKEWRKDPPSDKRERYAAFRIDAQPKELEVTVTRFSSAEFNLLRNVRRWQGQLTIEQTEDVRDLADLVKREKIGAKEFKWFDETGLAVHMPTKPPEALASANKAKSQMPFHVKTPFTYTVPDGWVSKGRGDMAVEVFEIVDGDDEAEVTITPAGGTLDSNVKRWRGQVGLAEDLTPAEIQGMVKELAIPGIKNSYVDLANPKGPAGKNRILGVIIPTADGIQWFVKMTGPIELVGQHKDAFEIFVQSFKLNKR